MMIIIVVILFTLVNDNFKSFGCIRTLWGNPLNYYDYSMTD